MPKINLTNHTWQGSLSRYVFDRLDQSVRIKSSPIFEKITLNEVLLYGSTNPYQLTLPSTGPARDFQQMIFGQNGKASFVDYTGNPGDIPPTSLNLIYSASPLAITGFLLDSAIMKAFESIMYVKLNASPEKVAMYRLSGFYKSPGWQLQVDFLGDDTNTAITINNSGQLFITLGQVCTSVDLRFKLMSI